MPMPAPTFFLFIVSVFVLIFDLLFYNIWGKKLVVKDPYMAKFYKIIIKLIVVLCSLVIIWGIVALIVDKIF